LILNLNHLIALLVKVGDSLNLRVEEAHLFADASDLLLSMLSLFLVLVGSLLE
jgi:hypothetical protein